MFLDRLIFRASTSLLLIGALSCVTPLMAAHVPQPGVLPGSNEVVLPSLLTAFKLSPLPRSARQDAATPAQTGATPAPTPAAHHISRWVWVAIVAGVGIGVGAAVIASNSQSGKNAATSPTATIGVGTGGVTAGAP